MMIIRVARHLHHDEKSKGASRPRKPTALLAGLADHEAIPQWIVIGKQPFCIADHLRGSLDGRNHGALIAHHGLPRQRTLELAGTQQALGFDCLADLVRPRASNMAIMAEVPVPPGERSSLPSLKT
jgi:hypothetical protein